MKRIDPLPFIDIDSLRGPMAGSLRLFSSPDISRQQHQRNLINLHAVTQAVPDLAVHPMRIAAIMAPGVLDVPAPA